jgi:hypothetical protein
MLKICPPNSSLIIIVFEGTLYVQTKFQLWHLNLTVFIFVFTFKHQYPNLAKSDTLLLTSIKVMPKYKQKLFLIKNNFSIVTLWYMVIHNTCFLFFSLLNLWCGTLSKCVFANQSKRIVTTDVFHLLAQKQWKTYASNYSVRKISMMITQHVHWEQQSLLHLHNRKPKCMQCLIW